MHNCLEQGGVGLGPGVEVAGGGHVPDGLVGQRVEVPQLRPRSAMVWLWFGYGLDIVWLWFAMVWLRFG